MTILYDNNRRQKVLRGGRGVLVGGSPPAGGAEQAWPLVYNFEGDTVAETGTQLMEKSYHAGTMREGATVQVDDYDTFSPCVGNGVNLTQSFHGDAPTYAPHFTVQMSDDYGFLPSEGRVMGVEMLACSGGGSNSRLIFYAQDEDQQEGINVEVYGNSYYYVRTRHLGTWTGWLSGFPYGHSRNLHQYHWYYLAFTWNFSNNWTGARLFMPDNYFGADTGWVTMRQANDKTFASDKRFTKFSAHAYSSSVREQSLGQVRVYDVGTSGHGNGVIEPHNFVRL